VGLAETILGRLRLGALLPGLDVAVEGAARVCTSEHGPMVAVGGDYRSRTAPAHIDVVAELWNKTQHPVALIELRDARARGQDLVDGAALSYSFRPLTLGPAQPKTQVYFSLGPRSDTHPLVAGSGDEVEFSFRLGRNGRDRRVKLTISL
jgi:hypothetical protein